MARQILLIVCCITLLAPCYPAQAKKKYPPFKSVRIFGVASKKYNKVSLFRSGSSTKPYKTMLLRSDGKYSITIDIPRDMKQKDEYYLTDMRFWKDVNNNGIKEKAEPRSQCHFIIWYPSYKKVVMQIYDGPTHQIKSSGFKYNYR